MSIYTDIYQNVEFPLICTRGIIVFPNQEIVFDVGRSASIAAITAAKNLHDSFVVLLSQKDIMVEAVSVDNMYNFGSLCHIEFIRKEKDLYKVKVKSLARANINSITFDGSMYLANISVVDSYVTDKEEESIEVKNVIKECQMIFSELPNLPKDLFSQLTSTVDGEALSDNLGQFYPMELSSRQAILEQLDVNKRLILILQQFQLTRELKKIEDEISEKVKDSINDNQKEYYLREKLRAIKEELNEDDGDDSDSLLDQFMNNPYPDNIKEKAKEEIKRLEMMPSISSEASVIRSYLDWLSKVPYWQESQDNCDIKSIKEILDQDHYGIKKVKERILEYIAVKNMTGSLKAPILCLYGPPGVGKTSLAKSIARALNRKFVKISLGGVKDEAEIRGHRRTYLGSMPGRIIQGMKKAGTLNPVFLIDEIDKLSSDYKGDPSSAMLEVLDPEQNSMFSDHYIEEPYDLSDVLFIATANYKENIPAALYDRLEIIDISSYTEIEKLNIAREHLITKQMEANGLKKSQFILSDDMILYLIRHYTREAGVRNLERIIGTLCRKAVLDILKEGKKSVRITKKLLQTWLGRETFEYGLKENKDQVGVVTGLAYTQFGGDILPIEVNYFEGKGKFIVTGQLGDVMKESTEIALDYIKSNARKYNIDPEFFEKHDIHIHCPEGAVPKDGPSAGVTLTTALISALTKHPVKSDLAMTGEVTLRGNVLPIGGLKEKSLAAHRSGIKKIVIPKANIKDLEDVPQTVKDDVVFIPVERVDQVIKEALV